jgi:hypothetical protein
MSTQLATNAWPACHSALHIDRFLCGELDAGAASQFGAHLAGCARCSRAVAELSAAMTEPLPPLRVAPLPAQPLRADGPRWPRAAMTALTFAAVAASAAIAVFPRAPGARIKGPQYGLSLFVQHGGDVRRAGPGEPIAAGDSVRFAVTAPAPSWVAVLSVDPAGRASAYFPLGARAERVPAGAEVPLPIATRLDGTTGEEKILGLFCSSAVELEPVLAALQSGNAFVPDGCQVTRWSFVKR